MNTEVTLKRNPTEAGGGGDTEVRGGRGAAGHGGHEE